MIRKEGIIMRSSVRSAPSRRAPSRASRVLIKGFVRACLTNVRTGEIEMTPWMPNVLTSDGLQNYICHSVGSIAGSKYITHMQVATQTAAPVTSQTSASGEFESRKATTNTFAASGTLQCTASWATNEATQSTLGAVALYNTSSGGTAGSIATFTQSTKTTDQTLSVSYQWRFATA